MDDWLTIKVVYYYKRMLWKDRQWKDSYCTFFKNSQESVDIFCKWYGGNAINVYVNCLLVIFQF